MGIASGGIVVEGRFDFPEHIAEAIQHLVVLDSHHPLAERREPRLAGCVLGFSNFMDRAVDFDNQLTLGAIEIDDEPVHWMLAAEAESTQSLGTERFPKNGLGRSGLMAHPSGMGLQLAS